MTAVGPAGGGADALPSVTRAGSPRKHDRKATQPPPVVGPGSSAAPNLRSSASTCCQATYPTARSSSVGTEQRENLDAILRQSVFPAGADVSGQRRLLRELTSARPLPADVTMTAATPGGVRTAEITTDGIEPRHVVLYLHGGVYVLGDAFLAADLASQVGRRTGANVISELELETAGAVTLTVCDVVDWPVVAA